MRYDKEKIQILKQKYRAGTKIRINQLYDKYESLIMERGIVRFVDDIGTIHCLLDGGKQVGVIPDVDKFEVIDED